MLDVRRKEAVGTRSREAEDMNVGAVVNMGDTERRAGEGSLPSTGPSLVSLVRNALMETRLECHFSCRAWRTWVHMHTASERGGGRERKGGVVCVCVWRG